MKLVSLRHLHAFRVVAALGGIRRSSETLYRASSAVARSVSALEESLGAQLQPERDTVDLTPNCGNMLAAVLPFALERGLLPVSEGTTTARILTLNTGMQCDVTVLTPGGRLQYGGEARIDGVPGTAAPITISFLDTAGSVCPSLLPTGRVLDEIQVNGATVQATLIDNGMPMVLVRAADFGLSGYEGVEELNGDAFLRARLEALRLAAGPLMGLSDVSAKSYPKMCLVAAPAAGGSVSTRCFIPHVCHEAIGVLAANSASSSNSMRTTSRKWRAPRCCGPHDPSCAGKY
jgi:4-oxalomesaconate tautomerase